MFTDPEEENDKLEQIKALCEKITDKENLFATFKEHLSTDGLIFITLYYRPKTRLNVINDDVVFLIKLSENFPLKEPYVSCITNFVEPTLFDNRNLLYSIIRHYWPVQNNSHNITQLLEEIIENIPKFLIKVKENIQSKTLVYYGDFQLYEIYEVNDFLLNETAKFFRIKFYRYHGINKDKNDICYLILSELYFLIFEPAPGNLKLGKLIYKGKILDFENRKLKTVDKNNEILSLDYKDGKKENHLLFYTVSETLFFFCNEVDKKISKLRKKFLYFVEDDIKIGDDLLDVQRATLIMKKKNIKDIENDLNLISHKEKLYNEKKNT